jgi:hypothetical protein
VVKSLISGLCSNDGVVHLHPWLGKLPSGIEELYNHMLNSIPSLDAEETSQMIQIFPRSGHDLDLVTLERALRTMDYYTVFNMKIPTPEDPNAELAKYRARLNRMNLRLNSRCEGLLEALEVDHKFVDNFEPQLPNSIVSSGQRKRKRDRGEMDHASASSRFRQSKEVDSEFYQSEKQTLEMPFTTNLATDYESNKEACHSSSSFQSIIESNSESGLLKIFYLRRTVRDYLERPKVWESLQDKTRAPDFDPYASLVTAYIIELKYMSSSSSNASSRAVEIQQKVEKLNVPSTEPCVLLETGLNRIIGSCWWGGGEEVEITSSLF